MTLPRLLHFPPHPSSSPLAANDALFKNKTLAQKYKIWTFSLPRKVILFANFSLRIATYHYDFPIFELRESRQKCYKMVMHHIINVALLKAIIGWSKQTIKKSLRKWLKTSEHVKTAVTTRPRWCFKKLGFWSALFP